MCISVASLVGQGLQGTQASVAVPLGLQNTGSIVAAGWFTCSEACEIFPDQGLSSCLLHWQMDSLPLSHQGSPSASIIHIHISILFQILFPYRLLQNIEQSSWSCVKMQMPGSAHVLLRLSVYQRWWVGSLETDLRCLHPQGVPRSF